MFGLAISASERRTVLLGAAISVVALFIAYGVVPFARRWQAREDVIAAEADRLARLRSLIASESALRDSAVQKAAALAATPQRLLSGRSTALAAAALQSALQGYADASQVTVSQLDVAGEPDTTAALPVIPATISAIGDIHGITDLLVAIQHGPLALEIADLSIRQNAALRGDLLQATLTLQAAYEAGPERAVAEASYIHAPDAERIVNANIFSASRKAPRTRYRPFAAESAAPEVTMPPAETGEVGLDNERVPQLSGIMLGPSGPSALLRLDPGKPDAQVYREGERGGRYRVLKINEQSVVLSGPAGRIVLRLQRPL